jgi:hypothetical protein
MALELSEGFLSTDASAESFRQHPQPGADCPPSTHVWCIGAGQEETAVARYDFDILDGAQVVRDDEGAEFDSLDAAVQAAARAAAGIGQGRLARGESSEVVVEVRDERGQRVCTIRASMEIDWHVSRSHGPRPWSA